MSDYVIISDSTCDLNDELVAKWDVKIQPMSFRINNAEYKNYFGERDLSLKEFYDFMRKGDIATTSQLNVIDVEAFFRPYLEKGQDILCVAFSSGLSGSFNAIRLVKDNLLEVYPERKICVIDSLCASSGEGVLLYRAVRNRKKGLSILDNASDLDSFKFKIRHWFTVGDIDTLRRGGRLSNSTAFVAKMLKIKPVLKADNEGHLIAVYKKIGRKQALNQLIDSSIAGYDVENENITIISHADCEEDAIYVKNALEAKYKELGVHSDIYITKIGPVIGAHAGPGTVAVFTVGDKR